ncbi:hypothetical protein LVJ83_00710 [Uruburuella testudinis]|uniref:Dioxygenase n=1 Tax=Uruburuella testudinis TaxID=1282863 RepID=A0ABY4DUC0_9NEIS|nr:hypothetical protein [Uruburuella testudinis]UOO82033.1 hypothetical protein LVJ83_00710 [Uruburuella testudinis]
MENNILYQAAQEHANLHRYGDRYQTDALTLKNNAFVVSDIEIDSALPKTLVDIGFLPTELIPTASINLLAYITALGLYPVVYQGENEGRLIRHVVPKKGLENEISSYGSSKTFYPHVDNPDLKLRGENSYPPISIYTSARYINIIMLTPA